MTSYPATWLADVLRAAGCRVIEESGWKTRGRPASTGSFQPRAVLRHWDASSPGSHNVSTLINGNSNAPGPLCSIWTCDGNSSHGPSVHVIAAGRCNHGGTGDGWGVIPRDDANTYAVGHEIRQTVDKPWPADQLEQVRLAEGAILKHLGAVASNALCSHSEYADGRKIDTTEGDYGQDMDTEREAVASGGTGEGDDLKSYYVGLSTKAVGTFNTTPKNVVWESESSDQGDTHSDGAGGVYAVMRCTMTGVVEVQVTEAGVDVNVMRVDGDGDESLVGREFNCPTGYAHVPFVGVFSDGDRLYVRLNGDDAGGAAGQARLTLVQTERT